MSKVLEKMMEIEKLKTILFTKKQKDLFDSLPRPVISFDVLNGINKNHEN